MSMTETMGVRLTQLRVRAGLSQRELASATGISQPTLSRIESGDRAAKLNELMSIAWAIGCGLGELTGESAVRGRVQCIARSTDDITSDGLHGELVSFLELDADLDDRGVLRAS